MLSLEIFELDYSPRSWRGVVHLKPLRKVSACLGGLLSVRDGLWGTMVLSPVGLMPA
jgi:hypothetical protein